MLKYQGFARWLALSDPLAAHFGISVHVTDRVGPWASVEVCFKCGDNDMEGVLLSMSLDIPCALFIAVVCLQVQPDHGGSRVHRGRFG